jgi:hypothetical protein
MPGYVSIRQLNASIRQHTSAYVSQMPAYVSIHEHTSAGFLLAAIPRVTPEAYVSIRQHTSAYVSIRQHTPAYDSIRHTVHCSREPNEHKHYELLHTYADVC